MKSIIRKLTLCALLGAAMTAHAAPVLFPNGDFETAGGTDWGKSPTPPTGNFLFPATGGNPGGYGEMGDTQPGGYAVLISNNDQPYPLSSLGLVAGNTYTFSYDMIASVAGAAKGGIKVESWSATALISNSGDQRVTAASTGWATYTYNYQIDPEATHIKIVPLWTPNETVGFDNIGVNNTPFALFAPLQIPNGDFEIPAGANWSYYTDGFGLTYPTSDGNPGGNAVIDGTSGGGYGVLVAFSNAEKRAASLGLTPGGPCTIQMDMKIVSGTNVGGLKLEGPAGFAPVIEPAPLAGVGVWATYTFEFTLQNGINPVSQFKIVPLGRSGSIVAYDNIKIVLPGPPAPLQATITQGISVSWAASATNQYQPQEGTSVSGPWTNLGAPIVGNTVSSRFDSSTSPFYQVLQSIPSVQEASYNGGFEENDGFPEGAEGWEELGFTGPSQDFFQAPQRILTGAHTGDACMQVKVQNAATEAQSGKSLLKQDTLDASVFDGEITPGSTYTFSFWAKQINVGVSYVQQYKVAFLNSSSGIVGTTGDVNFSAGAGWTQITVPGLVAPAGAVTALIEIVGLTGAVDNGSGEVHIDDVSLLASSFSTPTPIAAATVPAVEISWESLTGMDYQVQSSGDLSTWSNFGGVIVGDGSIKAVYDTMANPSKFYKVGEF